MKKIALILALMVSINVSAQKRMCLYSILKDSTLTVFYGINPDTLACVDKETIYDEIKRIVIDSSVKEFTPISCRDWFAGCGQLEDIVGLENLNTEHVTDMSGMFCGCAKLKTLNLSTFNTSNVISMSRMFYGCNRLKSIDLGYFNTEKVVDMSYMFANDSYSYGCTLQTLDLSSFDTKNVEKMEGMFKNTNITTIYVSDKWTTANVKQSDDMFDCWSICGGKGTEHRYNDDDATYARIDGGKTNPGYLTSIEYKKSIEKAFAVFKDSTLILYYDVPKPNNGEIYYLGNFGEIERKVAYVVFDESFRKCTPLSCAGWFYDFYNLLAIRGMKENLNTEKCVNMMKMFASCAHLKTLDLSGFNTANVENMSQMFYVSSSLRTIYVGVGWSTKSVTESEYMFGYCKMICGEKGTRLGNTDAKVADAKYARIDDGKQCPGFFTKIDTNTYLPKAYGIILDSTLTLYYGVPKLQTDSAYFVGEYLGDESKIAHVVFDKSFKNFYPTSCANWFAGLKNLKDIRGMKEYLNTQNVVYMDYMFSGCEKLESIDLSGFNTQKTKYMGAMFSRCKMLKTLDLHTFNTSNVYDMCEMFMGCSSIDTLDLSMFNTTKVKYTNFMFWKCANLKTIYVSEQWTMKSVQSNISMFAYCDKLYGGKGSTRLGRYGESEYAHIDEGAENPGLLTRKCDKPFYYSFEDTTKRPYYILKDSVLTYFYGVCKDFETNIFFPDVKEIVFDKSFKEYYPKNTDELFTKHSKANYRYSNGNNVVRIVDMEKYLNTDSITDMSQMFKGFWNLETIDLSGFNTENVTDMSEMFQRCEKLEKIDLSGFKTENVTDMREMFCDCEQLKILDLSHLDVKNVTNMSAMFEWCRNIENIDFTGFQTENVTNMSEMFKGCSKLKNLDLTSFNTSNVSDMSKMFLDCVSLESINKQFNTSNVTDMSEMFSNCKRLKNINLSSFNTSNVINMSGLFNNCYSLQSIDLSNFDTKKVKNMGRMFSGIGCEHLDLKNINVENVLSFYAMFDYCTNLKSIDLSSFKTDSIINMHAMFRGCSSLTELDLTNFNTANVYDMGEMFMLCPNLKTIYVSEGWKTDSIKPNWYSIEDNGINNIFSGCNSLVGGKGTIYNPTNMSKDYAIIDGGESSPGYLSQKGDETTYETAYAVFNHGTLKFCYGKAPIKSYPMNVATPPDWLENAPLITKVVFDKSFAKFKPITCLQWFAGCFNLTKIEGMKENLNTEDVASMAGMFANCFQLQHVDLTGFNTAKVTEMNEMFYECKSLQGVDLLSFDTRNVTRMGYMFTGCESIKSLDLSSFNTSKTLSIAYLCKGCKNLTDIKFGNFDFSSYEDYTPLRNLSGLFEGCSNLTVLDLSNFKICNCSIVKMFFGCTKLTNLQLFVPIKNRKGVYPFCQNMAGLFYGCQSLKTIDLSSFTVDESPNHIDYMFSNCNSLETIYVSDNWNNIPVDENNDIFEGCHNLVGGKGTKWNENNVSDKTYLRIDGGADKPGYFTRKE